MKEFFLKFSKSKWSKVFACCLICTVFISMFAINSSAATNYDTAQFSFDFYRGSAKFYHGPSSTTLYKNGTTYVSSVNFNDVTLIGGQFDTDYFYYTLTAQCNFSSIIVNGVSYSGVLYSPSDSYVDYSSSKTYSFSAYSSTYDSSVTYVYMFKIPVMSSVSSSDFEAGYHAGKLCVRAIGGVVARACVAAKCLFYAETVAVGLQNGVIGLC